MPERLEVLQYIYIAVQFTESRFFEAKTSVPPKL